MDTNIPSWDQYFMEIATAVSKRSKDSTTKVGCVIVDENNRIIGHGYNGMAAGILETDEMWQKPEKYKWVLHSELNAITHLTKSAKGATIYTTLCPCEECAKVITSAGIKRVVYLDDKYDNEITRTIFNWAGISYEQLK